MNYGPISFEGTTLNGSPVFKDTEVSIQSLFEYLEDGKSLDRFLDDFPSVNKKEAVEVIRLAKLAVTQPNIVKEIVSKND
jgi:uncharacterized protein (DUF433 family)